MWDLGGGSFFCVFFCVLPMDIHSLQYHVLKILTFLCWKYSPFSIELLLYLHQKTSWLYLRGSTSGFSLVSLICARPSADPTQPWWLPLHGKSWNQVTTPSTLLLFKIALAILGPMAIHVDFRISLSTSTQFFAGVLIRIILELELNLGGNWYLYYVQPSGPFI